MKTFAVSSHRFFLGAFFQPFASSGKLPQSSRGAKQNRRKKWKDFRISFGISDLVAD